ncbi:hypothetical protein J4N45_10430 [Vibrio sp. SCSIO 43140]|uniref:hypothetical protein n=1 Tax=Vibrio sp. SCSIO 43140 TaxID=2819100 RepID=UPI002075E886|nr:hypothetical protein [Vibrio sp. SCSIO 43140]USD58946.1 hypothetical protein J4N45_10430 [Vibrio sp. SCSIO 43140]
MTQHVFTTETHSVFCGYDRPLQGFFLVIEKLGGEDIPLYSNLDETDPTLVHPKSFDHFANVLEQHAIEIPDGLIAALNDDLKHNRGNGLTNWDKSVH